MVDGRERATVRGRDRRRTDRAYYFVLGALGLAWSTFLFVMRTDPITGRPSPLLTATALAFGTLSIGILVAAFGLVEYRPRDVRGLRSLRGD